MKQSQMNFKEIRLVLLLFLPLSPSQASHSEYYGYFYTTCPD